MLHRKKIIFTLLIITACAAVGNVRNPHVHADGTQELYVRSNPPGADCVLQNDTKEYKLKAPSYVTVKAEGDLKITCTNQNVKKSCVLPSYTNYEPDKSDWLAYVATFKKTQWKYMESGDAYDNTACLDFSLDIDDGNCDDMINNGSSSAKNLRKNAFCAVNIEPQMPSLMQNNHGKCLVPGAYCLE